MDKIEIVISPKIEVSPIIRTTFYVINVVKVFERLVNILRKMV